MDMSMDVFENEHMGDSDEYEHECWYNCTDVLYFNSETCKPTKCKHEYNMMSYSILSYAHCCMQNMQLSL